MKKNELKFFKNWEEIRERGRKKYAISTGISFGIIVTAIVSALNYFTLDIFSLELIAMSIFLLSIFASLFYGTVIWNLQENKYKKLISKRPL